MRPKKSSEICRWVKVVLPALLKQKKWLKYKYNRQVGYVVLRKDETAAGQTHKYVCTSCEVA
jgi:hypothetical protein